MKKCLIHILCLISIFFCTSCSNGYKRAIKNYPNSREFPTKAEAISFAKELKDDKNSLIDEYSIEITYDYRVALDPEKYRYPYSWKSEKIKWE